MKNLLLGLLTILLIGCSGVKRTQVALNSGNYDQAINNAIEKLRKDKDKRGNQEYILILEEAYAKAEKRDLSRIEFLVKDNNPANLTEIYETYSRLQERQRQIKPLTPLYIRDENRDARFRFRDYSAEIISFKNDLSDHLYEVALEKMSSARTKRDFRSAYEDLDYINAINPAFRDVPLQMDIAHQKGVDYVMVNLYNDSETILPKRLEQELLNFNTYGLNELWTIYHTEPQQGHPYDYEMEIAFTQILVSPEQVKETQIIREKTVKDGWRYEYDRNGNVKKDSLGNDIKVDKFTDVTCVFREVRQFKAVQVQGAITYLDLNTQQKLGSYPLSSEFIFEHIYATEDGDLRALSLDDRRLLELGPVTFPSDEQMVYDAGEDIKARIKAIVTRQRFNTL
ncbi:hypothetical protein [Robertkochia aurantiaca]|uniref:hypothetical protein n=1 Tax=Robertkochia aurantiaca TaxID=2873700 RepID=UPI001CC92015|nr:hypothetical protein [Robertkochia sp. 3YJGBD-33]